MASEKHFCTANAGIKENWYSAVFARIYDPFMEQMEQKVLQYKRKALLSDLKGDILEVGAGTGVNLGFYNKEAKVVAIEPSAFMLDKAKEKLQTENLKAQIELVETGIGDELLEDYIPANGFDAVVFTLVLCTIPKPEEALKACIDWLKPGGKLVMLEHIAASGIIGHSIQKAINPLWNHLAEGCHLDRQTDQLIKQMGLELLEEDYFTKALPFYQSVWQKPL